MNICYIMGAAPTRRRIQKREGDYVIAADGGYAQLGAMRPDLVVGDFDSLAEIPANEAVIRHPVRKDDTDTMLAIKLGLARGFRRFVLYGALGGRLDHTLANLQALAYLHAQGARGSLAGDRESAMLLTNESCTLCGEMGSSLSVFAYGTKARGVWLEGLSYPLENAVLSCDFPLGVSNAFMDVPARISVEDGQLLVLWSGSPFAEEALEGISPVPAR